MKIETGSSVIPRRGKRTRVLLNGALFTRDGLINVRVKDVSAEGAHVQAEIEVQSNCDVVFRKGSLFVAARVTWTRRKDAGLRFYRDLTSEEAATLWYPAELSIQT
jgi:hypothetical protein